MPARPAGHRHVPPRPRRALPPNSEAEPAEAVRPAHRPALKTGAGRDRGRGHGRVATRTAKAVCVRAGIGFPYAAQAVQVVRRRRGRSGRWRTQTVYAVTSLATHQAGAVRGHWTVENRLHGDVTFDEDHSQVHTGNGPRIMASLRNLTITVLRLTGVTNVAAALHHHARRPDRPLHTVMTC